MLAPTPVSAQVIVTPTAQAVVATQATTTAPLTITNPTNEEVAAYIKARAIEKHVDPSVALNIACVESKFNETAKNKYSTATGVYQWLYRSFISNAIQQWGSLEGRERLDYRDNIDLAIEVLAERGTSDWNSSKYSGFGGGWLKKPYERGLCGVSLA